MSKLQGLLMEAREGLTPWDRLPPEVVRRIAARCGPEEVAALHDRIAVLHAELANVPAWDGDTADDIHRTLEFFDELRALLPDR